MKRLFVLTIILSLILFSSVFSQNYAGKIGLLFSTTSQISYSHIGFSYWLNDNVSLEPTFGFQNYSSNGNSSTTMTPGARIIFHMSPNKLKPYFGAGINVVMLTVDSDSYSDMMLSGLYGVEYFITKWFSLGGEFKLNVIMTGKDVSPSGYATESTIISTGSAIILRFYLK
jgi:hypothetical protein